MADGDYERPGARLAELARLKRIIAEANEKTPLVLVGAGDLGREVYARITCWPGFNDKYKIAGVIDDDLSRDKNVATPFLGTIADYQPTPGVLLVNSIGASRTRARVYAALKAKGGKFATLIAPNATVCQDAEIGEGALVFDNAVISANAKLGEDVLVHNMAVVGHDVTVGNDSVVEAFVFLGGHAEIGAGVQLHTRSTVLPSMKVGDNAVVGVSSTCLTDIPQGTTVFGTPAKPLKF